MTHDQTGAVLASATKGFIENGQNSELMRSARRRNRTELREISLAPQTRSPNLLCEADLLITIARRTCEGLLYPAALR